MPRWICALALVALASAACGESASTPPAAPTTAASGSNPVALTPGATIMGNVAGGAKMVPMAAQVLGTNISSPVESDGDFSLKGIPEGDVELRFLGSGVDASVGLSPVKAGDIVNLLVGVSGATATVQSESRNSGGKVELEGLIDSVAPPSTLTVSGRTVTTAAGTVIRDDTGATKAFGDLKAGQRVHVAGTMGTGVINANTITIQSTAGTTPSPTPKPEPKPEPPQDDSASVEGMLTAVSPPTLPYAPPLTLTIDAMVGTTKVTTLVKATSTTVVQRRGDVQTVAALAVGQTIHAVGARQTDGSIIARMLQIKDDGPGGAFMIEGSLGGLKGSCPALTFVVNGYAIATSGGTTFVTPCADLKNGFKVEVGGTRQADGSVLAMKVTKK